MKNLIIGLLFVAYFQVHAQTAVNYNGNSGTGVATLQVTLFNDESVKGSVYLFKDWVNSARMYTDGGEIIDIKNINFNTYNGKFSSKISKDSIFTFHKIYKVEVNGKNFRKIDDKFYEVLHVFDDKQIFLKEYFAKIEPELHKITSTVIGPGKYVIENKFYLYKNRNLEKIWLSKKNVLKIVDSEKSLVLKQARKRKLSFSKEKDIIEIFKYYDTL